MEEERFWARPTSTKVGTELTKVGTELVIGGATCIATFPWIDRHPDPKIGSQVFLGMAKMENMWYGCC